MPTFIDESGCTGCDQSSLPYFRLAAVWLPTTEDANACRASIATARETLGLGPDYEFKFSKTGTARRTARRREFFSAAMRHPFRFVVSSHRKPALIGSRLASPAIHWRCIVFLASYLRSFYLEEEARRYTLTGHPAALDDRIIVDDNQDGDYLSRVKSGFHAMPSGVVDGGKLAGSVRFRGSGPDELVQLADMVVGASGAMLDGNPEWYELIKERAIAVDEWSEN